jgi:hypothetical protein
MSNTILCDGLRKKPHGPMCMAEPHDAGGVVMARPWTALESFEASNAVDHHVEPDNEPDEGS